MTTEYVPSWREARDEELAQARERLNDIGERAKVIVAATDTLRADREREVKASLEKFDRGSLSVADIARLVGLTSQRIYQLEREVGRR